MASSTVLSTLCVAQKAGTPTDVLLVADGSCAKIRELLAEALVPVLWLDGDQDPLEAVSAALAQRRRQGQPVETLHWVSHGSPGVVQVGARAINSANLLANAHNLTQWELSSLALWSCEAGSDRRFIALWKELTGASVWSSSGVLGHLEGGSCDWALTSSSAIEAPALPVTAAQQQSWTGQLTATSTRNNGLGSDVVKDVYASGDIIYAATSYGLGVSTDDGDTFNSILGNLYVNAVYVSGDTIYAGTQRDGLKISRNGGASFDDYLGSATVNDVYAREQNIYAATFGALSISTDDGVTFRNFTTTDGLVSNVVNAVYESDGTIYAGTGGGLSISTINNNNVSFTNHLEDRVVYDVYASGDTIYAATRGGLEISTNGGADFTNHTNGLGSDSVYGVYASGNIIYAATSNGLSISTDGGESFTNFTTDNDLGSDSVLSVYESGGTIYAGTVGGLSISAAPTLATSTPADNTTDVAVSSDLELTFSEDISAGTGDILIKRSSDGKTAATIPINDPQVSIIGDTLTINPTADLDAGTDYYLEIAPGVIRNTGFNIFAGLTTSTDLNFTTAAASGATAPTVSSSPAPPPAPASPQVVVDNTPTVSSSPAPAPAPASPPAVVDNTPVDPAPAGSNIQPSDDDGDGIKEVVTASDGTTVDGNRDGIADAEQTDVAGLRLINDGAIGSDYGAVQVSDGTQLTAVTLISPDSETGVLAVTGRDGSTVLAELPSGISNNFAGAVAFDVSGLEIGGSTSTTINLPTGLQLDSANSAYMRFNYLTNQFTDYVDNQGNPLYSFQDTNGDGTPDAVVLQLVDGDPQWDGDGVANGAVVDPGFLGTGVRTFTGTKCDDTLIGNVLANELDGSSGRDWLYGGLGDDVLWGGKGKDYLHGGEGADFISGGKKWRDYIVYSAASDSTLNRSDTVKFHRNDRFDFRDFDGDSLTEGRQVLRYIGKQAFSGSAGELRFTGRGLQADTTGDGQADFVVNFAKATPWFSEAKILI